MVILIENCVTLAFLKSIQNGNFSSLRPVVSKAFSLNGG